jgi:hypothetical protein
MRVVGAAISDLKRSDPNNALKSPDASSFGIRVLNTKTQPKSPASGVQISPIKNEGIFSSRCGHASGACPSNVQIISDLGKIVWKRGARFENSA